MRRLKARWLSYALSAVLVTSIASTVGVAIDPPAAFASGSGNEASVPSQPLAAPSLPAAEPQMKALAAPVWPAASAASADLSSLSAGELTSGTATGAAARSASTPATVVSVGPAPVLAVGPIQAAAVQGQSLSVTGGAADVGSAPASVDVQVLDRATIAAAGGVGLGVLVNRSDGAATTGPAQLQIDYSGFAQAYGGDFAGRLRLVELPACALTTPQINGCTTPMYVADAVNDVAAHTLIGTVDANPDPAALSTSQLLSTDGVDATAASGGVVTLTATGSSDAGDYRATDLKPTGSWSVSTGSGDFSYDVPITLPPPAYGSAPGLSLGYSSQSVDGMTSATNNQGSVVGLGWSLTSAFVERKYRGCAQDGQDPSVGDLCWDSPYQGTASGHAGDAAYVISLNGRSSNLVPTTTANLFRLEDDPGWLARRLTGAPNADKGDAGDTGEYWRVYTPDGSIYTFGYGKDWDDTTATNSVAIVPVFGNDAGEPCNDTWADATHQDSRVPCNQAYRWMLDRVSDKDEVKTSYRYALEENGFRSIEGPNVARAYTSNAELTEIDYGWANQQDTTVGDYTDRVVLSYQNRCLTRNAETDPLRNTAASCPSIASNPDDYPDVPVDKICDPTVSGGDYANGCIGSDGVTSYSPVYYGRDELWDIHTYTLDAGTHVANVAEQYQLRHTVSNDDDVAGTSGSPSFLWLDYIQRETYYGGTDLILPVMNFGGKGAGSLDNIVGGTNLVLRRITTVNTDLGGLITVTYGHGSSGVTCSSSNLPVHEYDNQMECFKQYWTPEGSTTARSNWFKKFVVTKVDSDPNVGAGVNHDGDEVQTTVYDYSGGHPAWRFPIDPTQQRDDESWTDWRGYNHVTVTQGSGTNTHSTGYYVFQGMDGDRNDTDDTSEKSVTVTGLSSGPPISYTDSSWLGGMVYEESHRDNVAAPQEYVINDYTAVKDTAAYPGLRDARIVRQTKTRTYQRTSTAVAGDYTTWREGETQSFYDSSDAAQVFGLATSVEDDGQVGNGSDNSCVVYGYAINNDPIANDRWFALPNDTSHHAAICGSVTAGNQDGHSKTFYDSTTFGAPPTDGDPIEVDTYTAAGTLNSVKHSYDNAGRVTSTTDGNGNVSHVDYTPATGWPVNGVTTTTPTPDIAAQDDFGGPGHSVSSSKTPFFTIVKSSPAFGLPTWTQDANGQVTTLQYDTAGRLSKVWRPTDGVDPTTAGMTFDYDIPTNATASVPDSVTGPPKVSSGQRQHGTTYLKTYTYLDGLGQTRETQGPAPDGSAGRMVDSTRYDKSGYVEGTSDPYYNSAAPGSAMVNPAGKDLPAFHNVVPDWAGRTVEADLEHGDGTTVTVAPEGHTYASYWPDKTIATPAVGAPTTTNYDVFGNASSIQQANDAVWANYRDLTAGDFNGDGHPDLIAINTTDQTLRQWLGDGHGNLAYQGLAWTGTWGGLANLVAADFTGDGKTDIAAVVTSTSTLRIYPGNGNGTFDSGTDLGTGWNSYRDLTAADVTGDGKADLLAINTSTANLTRWNGDGTGHFAAAATAGSGWANYQQLTAADLTGDGKADLLAINNTSGDLHRWNGTGTGGFSAGTIISSGGWTTYSTVLGDYTGDGKADLLGLRSTDNTMRRYNGDGAGALNYTADIANTSEIVTAYSYDDAQRLLSITDNNADLTTYTYNWSGQKTAAHDPDAGNSSTTYDHNGNISTTTDANNTTVTTLYDALNRPTTVWAGTSGTGTKLDWYTYDGIGADGAARANFSFGATRASTSTSYYGAGANAYVTAVDGYDSDGRSLGATITIPASEDALAGSYDTVTTSYDDTDHPLAVGYPAVGSGDNTLPAETVTTGYDSLGHAATLTSSLASYVSATSYTNWGPLAGRVYGSGSLTAHRTYNWDQTSSWLTNIATTVTNGGSTSTAQNDVYGYDNGANVKEFADTAAGQQQCYSYDGLNRLTAAYTATSATTPTQATGNCGTTAANHTGGPAPYDLAYTYDSAGLGNLKTVVNNMTATPTTSTYSYAADTATNPARPHAVTAVTRTGGGTGTDNYSYDNNGDMNTRTITSVAGTIAYTPQHQTDTITAGGNTTQYLYDAAGNLLIRKGPDGATLYLPGQELHATGNNITPTRYYTCGTATVAQRVGGNGTNGTLTWLTHDNQNSAQLTINTTSGAVTRQQYLPFGAQRGTQTPPTGSQHAYLNRIYDPTTGLLQDGARLYDPNLAQFLTPDPVVHANVPQDLNAYSYSLNSPITLSDPSGLDSCATGGQGCTQWDPSCGCYVPPGGGGSNNPPGPPDPHNGGGGSNNPPPAPGAPKQCAGGPYNGCAVPVSLDGNKQAPGTTQIGDIPGVGYLGNNADIYCLNHHPDVSCYISNGIDILFETVGADLQLVGPEDDPFPCLNSFAPDTPVLMGNGQAEPIKDIKIGDKVIATDPTSNTTAPKSVLRLHDNVDTDLADVTISAGGTPIVLHTTQNHPFWDQTMGAWMPAAALKPGDRLRTVNGQIASIVAVKAWTGHRRMLNLTVQSIHTYYVLAGQTPVLVHNTGSCGPTYENPGHHDPRGGPNPYNPNKAVLPSDAEAQFGNSVLVDGTRWTKIGTGKNAVYYRYFDTGNDMWHWSGSTNGVSNRGASVAIPLDQVPISVRRM